MILVPDLGGANMHCTKSGVTDHFAETEEDALHKVRCIVENLARLPKVQLPLLVSEPPAYSAEELMGVIPKVLSAAACISVLLD